MLFPAYLAIISASSIVSGKFCPRVSGSIKLSMPDSTANKPNIVEGRGVHTAICRNISTFLIPDRLCVFQINLGFESVRVLLVNG
jgi:hypothetical protein